MERVSKSALGIFCASLVSSAPCQMLTPRGHSEGILSEAFSQLGSPQSVPSRL